MDPLNLTSQAQLSFGSPKPPDLNPPLAPPQALSVSQLTMQIRSKLEPAFRQVWVQGELSNLRPATSGHLYFSLKDASATLSAAYFRSKSVAHSAFLKDGLQVLCRGKISIYPPRGSYQLIVEQIEALGRGSLSLAFEELKMRLQAEGLFASERKRSLPRFPKKIALITAPQAAALQDMLSVLKRRAPQVEIFIFPALVQGEQAATQLIRALEQANQFTQTLDLIVLARGGGSMEDLWCFNHEDLVRKIASSRLPVISAVGHEIDFTLSDFVSDLRAPTPSAAAEILSTHWLELPPLFSELAERLKRQILRELQVKRLLLQQVVAKLVSPKDRLREQKQRLDEASARLMQGLRTMLACKRSHFKPLLLQLDALSPLRVLERGFTLIEDPSADGPERVVKSCKQVRAKQRLTIRFRDGLCPVEVQDFS